MRGKVLVVDDQLRARRILVEELRDAEFEVCEAVDGRAGWRAFEEHAPDVVITDIVMPAEDGLTLLERIRERSDVPILLFTAYGSAEVATHAFRAGADDFICGDEAEIDEIVEKVRAAVDVSHGGLGRSALERRIVGSSPTLSRLRRRIAGAAPLRVPILLSGDQGTGKSLITEILHELGPRPEGAMAVLSPESTSLPPDREPSTVVLEQVDAFGETSQAYWLRRIEDLNQEGAPRLIATTTTRIADLQRNSAFRAGIGRVLLPLSLELPRLSKIREDIPSIAQVMATEIGKKVGRRATLTRAASIFLMERDWHENAAELYRALERAISFSTARKIDVPILEDIFDDLSQSIENIRARDGQDERERLLQALRKHGGNISKTAEALGKSRASIYRMIERHDIPLRRPRT
jgi:DNA-binding NtrC family response regulator